MRKNKKATEISKKECKEECIQSSAIGAAEEETSSSTAFKTVQSLGRAVRKAKMAMPESPVKTHKVIKKFTKNSV